MASAMFFSVYEQIISVGLIKIYILNNLNADHKY